MDRKQNFQTIAWFNDIKTRNLLDLDPPYQRRSVWNQEFKDYFIDTLILNYPAPAIFLYEEISDTGQTNYHVVDGKQRLSTIFEFVSDIFPVSEKAQTSAFRGKYFKELPKEVKRSIWSYQFSVEYLPTDEEGTINKIFDRINRNTAKLSNQELRHAQFDGLFITSCEALADWFFKKLNDFPKITGQSRKQMKDVEFVSHLMLFLEIGAKGHSTQTLDEAFSERDSEWEDKETIESYFRSATEQIVGLCNSSAGKELTRTRFKNQADFYSLFAAVHELVQEGKEINKELACNTLIDFAYAVEDEEKRKESESINDYYNAARSASNDSGPRLTRIRIIKELLGSI
ncbi:DUF262 domain-containing protein [Pseudomonas oryzihabitans]|uniref:DUF262 domain-containing protein n=1 Tax=Pseudomonas oryzihabitans TaxID=47885 RepID=UPI0015E3C9B5|nr:DUF262 domain-containing protein [Pseudomonas psychrotolerans]MBA1260295.1 DUF262 domain-containing protein [Pseudomonas psychrotolerans]